MLSDVISKLLDGLLRPLLDTPQELPLVPLVKVFDRLLKFNLSGTQWMNLHELLEVEERLRNRELVSTACRGEEAFKLGSVRQLQDNLVHFSQWLRINEDAVLSVQNSRQEHLSHLVDVGVLQLHRAVDLFDRHGQHCLESSYKLLASLGDKLLTLFDNVRWLDVIVM